MKQTLIVHLCCVRYFARSSVAQIKNPKWHSSYLQGSFGLNWEVGQRKWEPMGRQRVQRQHFIWSAKVIGQTLSGWCGLWGLGVGRNHLLGSLELRLMNLKWRDCLLESGSSIIFYRHELYPELPSCFVKHQINDEDWYRRTNPSLWLIQQMFCGLLLGGWLNLRKIVRKLIFVSLRN